MVTAVTEVFCDVVLFGISSESVFAIKVQQEYIFQISWGNIDQLQKGQEVEGLKVKEKLELHSSNTKAP